jgi:menaquinone-dependent protoporphyrinogen IX oxidase
MKTLIIYTTLTGHTKVLANAIKSKLDEVDINEVKINTSVPKYKLFQILKIAILDFIFKKISYTHQKFDETKYDLIIIGFPIWRGEMPIFFKNILLQYNLQEKAVAFFCTHGSIEKTNHIQYLSDLKTNKAIATYCCQSPVKINTPEGKERLSKFILQIESKMDNFLKYS